MTDLRARRATTEDAAQLSALASRWFAHTYAAHNTPENMSAYRAAAFSETQQRREIEDVNGVVWIVECDGQMVGYAHLKFGSTPPSLQLPRPAELSRIYADPEWQGRGVGAELIQACIRTARERNMGALWLGVWEKNPRAIAFYKKHGFREAGHQVFQLGSDPQRDVVMLRDIDDD
jgi:diamine N-acetyltransferase